MRANPGGHIAPADVVGRDDLIARLWKVLERQSVRLTAERRMGKTSVIKKMVEEPPAGLLPVYRDLETFRTPSEFVEDVFRTVRDHLGKVHKTAVRGQKLLDSLGGISAAGFRLPNRIAVNWKKLLATTVADLAERQDCRIVFFWDELPLMLQNIGRETGNDEATAVLDILRQLRQTHDELRMVFTGSIGLHNVISGFREQGYSNAPVNDMLQQDLPPLALSDAIDLGLQLLAGEGLCEDSPYPTATAIARAVDCVPYYIHHVVDQMAGRRTSCAPDAVAELVRSCLTDAQDLWELQHYRDRVNTYYSDPVDQAIVLASLDVLAASTEPLPFAELFNLIKSKVVTEDIEKARHLLELLQRDHYVLLMPEGEYRFRYPMIQRWWRLHRG